MVVGWVCVCVCVDVFVACGGFKGVPGGCSEHACLMHQQVGFIHFFGALSASGSMDVNGTTTIDRRNKSTYHMLLLPIESGALKRKNL